MPDLTVLEGSSWADLRPELERILGHQQQDAVVVATSGSSGTPKRVRLTGAALRASGEATAAALDGPGRWLLALPTHHVAGLQVLARSVLAGTSPLPLSPGMPFTPASFATAAAQLGSDGPRYASLVPTQLHRLLTDPRGAEAAAGLTAVLLGGSAADPALLDRARRAGVPVVTTYGMSETCGGCVYDGLPLPGLEVQVAEGRISLAGPMLADGYVLPDGQLDAELTADRFVERDGTRWFVTDDRGRWGEDGRLQVLGRVDDLITTGGHKVDPGDVETALRALPEVEDAVVVGLSDLEWGQVVAALVQLTREARLDPALLDPAALRDRLRAGLPAHALPRRIVVGGAIPLLPSGKPDRTRARDALRGPT